MDRVLKGLGHLQKRHFKKASKRSLWSKQGAPPSVENIAKDRPLRSPTPVELQQKPGRLVGNSYPEPSLPKEHSVAVSSP